MGPRARGCATHTAALGSVRRYCVGTHTRPPYIARGDRVVDGRGRELRLFPEAAQVVLAIRGVVGLQIALASRTGEPAWLDRLASVFPVGDGTLWSLPDHAEILPGSKLRHFKRLAEKSGVRCEQMLFFDDEPIANREVEQLGVTFVDAGGGLSEKMVGEALGRFAG